MNSRVREMTFGPFTAWDLIGFGGNAADLAYTAAQDHYAIGTFPDAPASVRIVGGRTLYEAVDNNGGEKVRLARLVQVSDPQGVGWNGTGYNLHQINRYIDHDTLLEVILPRA